SVAASATAVNPSSTLLTVRRLASPVSPFWIDPRNVNGPTQNTIAAVTNASATVLVVPRAKRCCSEAPSWLSRASTPTSEPTIPPSTIAPSMKSRLLVSIANFTPIASENMPLPELAQRGIVLTNNSGSYDIQIAEHLLAFVFAASRQLHRYRDSQRMSEWKDQPHQELRDATIVVYGMGSIGGEIGRLAS